MDTSTVGDERLRTQIDRFVAAYNAQDFAALGELLGPQARYQHHGQQFSAGDKQELLALMEQIAAGFPDRRFAEVRRVLPSGSHVVLEAVWTGTAAADMPGFASAGDVARLECCGIFAFDGEQIVAWDDFG